jgi:hypothetical protein
VGTNVRIAGLDAGTVGTKRSPESVDFRSEKPRSGPVSDLDRALVDRHPLQGRFTRTSRPVSSPAPDTAA